MFTDDREDERTDARRWAALIPESLKDEDDQAAHVLIPVDVLAELMHLSVSQAVATGRHHIAHRAVARAFVHLANSGYIARPVSQGSDS